jgi:hypothetical protein
MLIILFILLQFADAASTMYILHERIGREANPAMQAVIEFGGLAGFAIAKLFLTLLCIGIFVLFGVHDYVIATICLVYGLIVMSNCRIIYTRGKHW